MLNYTDILQTAERENVRCWMKSIHRDELSLSLFGPLCKFGTMIKLQSLSLGRDQEVDGNCVICIEPLIASNKDKDGSKDSQSLDETVGGGFVFKLNSCLHVFHLCCAKAILDSNGNSDYFICPICTATSGIRVGNQPDNGTMRVTKEKTYLPGFEGSSIGTILVTYNFTGGIQGSNHPNPGQVYSASSFPRTAYFPDNEKGNEIVDLLRIAFDRRLVFTVGISITSGQSNVITWNGIHHKTSRHGGPFGYPDDGYLDRVLAEIKEFGIDSSFQN